MSNGHDRTSIYEDYTMDEVILYYKACLARGHAQTLSQATASRVAQAEKEGWTKFTESIDKAVRSLVLPPASEHKKTRDASAFFAQINRANNKAKAPTP